MVATVSRETSEAYRNMHAGDATLRSSCPSNDDGGRLTGFWPDEADADTDCAPSTSTSERHDKAALSDEQLVESIINSDCKESLAELRSRHDKLLVNLLHCKSSKSGQIEKSTAEELAPLAWKKIAAKPLSYLAGDSLFDGLSRVASDVLAKHTGDKVEIVDDSDQHLVQRLVEGDTTAREKLIVMHLPLVDQAVKKFVRRNLRRREMEDDLKSVGMTGLVKAVDSLIGKGSILTWPIAGYLSTAIKNALNGFDGDTCHEIGPKRSSGRLARLAGIESVALKKSDREVSEVACAPPQVALSDLRDMINACCETQRDREIIELRSRGLSDPEIASLLGVTKISVWRDRKKIEATYDGMIAALGA